LKDWYIYDTSEKITDEAIKLSSAKILPKNTVLLALYGDGRTITSLGLLGKEATTNQACCAMICNPQFCDFRFLFYSLKHHRQELIGLALGASQRNLSGTVIRQFQIAVPSLRVQERISKVLSGYDELIENNTRRSAILEVMAQALYREWFVRFRFPGHENVPLTDDTPTGWSRSTLANCASFHSGGTPSKSRAEYWQGHIPWISSGELTAMRVYDSSLHLTKEGAEAGSRVVALETTLAVVRGMSLAKEFRLGMVSREVAFNQDLKALVARAGVDPFLLFHSLWEQRDQIRDRATEATHGTKKLDTRVLEQVPIMVPDKVLQRSFREHVEPLHLLWDKLSRKNELLRCVRDLLLPKLISGQLDVEHLDIDVGEPVTA
jgi:type I restriction enzyme S subunit